MHWDSLLVLPPTLTSLHLHFVSDVYLHMLSHLPPIVHSLNLRADVPAASLTLLPFSLTDLTMAQPRLQTLVSCHVIPRLPLKRLVLENTADEWTMACWEMVAQTTTLTSLYISRHVHDSVPFTGSSRRVAATTKAATDVTTMTTIAKATTDVTTTAKATTGVTTAATATTVTTSTTPMPMPTTTTTEPGLCTEMLSLPQAPHLRSLVYLPYYCNGVDPWLNIGYIAPRLQSLRCKRYHCFRLFASNSGITALASSLTQLTVEARLHPRRDDSECGCQNDITAVGDEYDTLNRHTATPMDARSDTLNRHTATPMDASVSEWDVIGHLTSLTSLTIDTNIISAAWVANWTKLTNLTDLTFRASLLAYDAQIGVVAQLTCLFSKLTKLDLSHCPCVTQDDLEQLVHLPHLRYLNLSYAGGQLRPSTHGDTPLMLVWSQLQYLRRLHTLDVRSLLVPWTHLARMTWLKHLTVDTGADQHWVKPLMESGCVVQFGDG